MAYPFTRLPTYQQFIDRLTSTEFGCEFETVPSPMEVNGDANDCVSIHFLKRTVNGEDRTYAFFTEDYGARMAPSALRSICSRLEIDTNAFGLTLG